MLTAVARHLSIKCLFVFHQFEQFVLLYNRPFPHSTSVRTNNRTRARLGWTFSYICCIFVHPNLDSVPLFVGKRERSINHLITGPLGNSELSFLRISMFPEKFTVPLRTSHEVLNVSLFLHMLKQTLD